MTPVFLYETRSCEKLISIEYADMYAIVTFYASSGHDLQLVQELDLR